MSVECLDVWKASSELASGKWFSYAKSLYAYAEKLKRCYNTKAAK